MPCILGIFYHVCQCPGRRRRASIVIPGETSIFVILGRLFAAVILRASPLVILTLNEVKGKNLTGLSINSATEESHNIEDRLIEESMERSFARRAQDDKLKSGLRMTGRKGAE